MVSDVSNCSVLWNRLINLEDLELVKFVDSANFIELEEISLEVLKAS